MTCGWMIGAVALWMTMGMGAGLAWAGEKADRPQYVQMDEVVVTASKNKARPVDVPVDVQVIDEEQIELSGAVDIGDLIAKYVTGHVHKYTGLLNPVGLRGFRTDSHGDDLKGSVLLLVDGHRIGTGNAAKINLDRIERVEVIKGPVSALYGSAAMGGVINLITKKGEGDLSAMVKGEVGSFDYYKTQASTGGEVNDFVKFYFTVSREDVGDYDDPVYGKVPNSGVTKNIIGGNLVLSDTVRQTLRIGGNFSDLESESPDWGEEGTYSDYDSDTENYTDKSHGYADLAYDLDFLGGKCHWKALAYYLWDRNHWYSGSNYDKAVRSYQTKYTDTTVGTDQQLTWIMNPWNRLVVGGGVDYLDKSTEAVADGLPSTPYSPNLSYNSKTLYLQDSLDLLRNRLNIIAALRYDQFDVKTEHPDSGVITDFNEQEETYDHFSPKIGMSVKVVNELLRLRFNLGEGFKSPSADQLSADFTKNGTHYLGNPDLDPETSVSWDMGADVFHDAYTLKLGYFHTAYRDKIVSQTLDVEGVSTRTYVNLGDAEMEGIDVSVECRFHRLFDWPYMLIVWSNATFNLSCEDKETKEDLLYISDYEVKSGLDMSYNGCAVQLSHVWTGPQMITNYDTYEVEEKDDFDFWDMFVSYRFAGHWMVKAGVLNLFDDRVEWVRGYLMPERNYRIGVSYTF